MSTNIRLSCRGIPAFLFLLILLTSTARAAVPCQVAVLEPSGDSQFSSFGGVLGGDADPIILGAPQDDSEKIGTFHGAVYVFRRYGLSWIEEAKLIGSQVGFSDSFGSDIALFGNRFIAGAIHYDPVGFAPGRAYVFRRDEAGWVEEALLAPLDGVAGDFFGIAIQLDDTMAAIGAPQAPDVRPGRVYIYERNNTLWTEDQVLVASDGTTNDFFGWTLDMDGNILAVGATQLNSSFPGAVYFFAWNGTIWNEIDKLQPGDGVSGDQFGTSLALEGSWLLIGSPNNGEAGFRSGAVYVYKNIGGTWQQVDKLLPPDPQSEGRFGSSINLEGEWAIFGAVNSGGSYVYRRSGDTWNPIYRIPAAAHDLRFPYALSGNGLYSIDAIPPCIPATSGWALGLLCLGVVLIATLRLRKGNRLDLTVSFFALVRPHRGLRVTSRYSILS